MITVDTSRPRSVEARPGKLDLYTRQLSVDSQSGDMFVGRMSVKSISTYASVDISIEVP